jgi:hypothetical protein
LHARLPGSLGLTSSLWLPACLSLSLPLSLSAHYFLHHLCFFLGTTSTLCSIHVHYFLCRVFPPSHYHYPPLYFAHYLLCPLCFFLGTTSTLQSTHLHYFLCPACFLPCSTKCSNMWFVFLIHPNSINLVHKVSARVSVSVK